MDISHITENVKISSSTRHDGICARIFKISSPVKDSKLANLFNDSFFQAAFLETWERSIVITVHKHGDLYELQNYRPISLLTTVSEILEKTINQQLTSFLNLLLSSQHVYS